MPHYLYIEADYTVSMCKNINKKKIEMKGDDFNFFFSIFLTAKQRYSESKKHIK